MADEKCLSTFHNNVSILQQTARQRIEENEFEQLNAIFQDILSSMTCTENYEIDECFISSLENLMVAAEVQLNQQATTTTDVPLVCQCVTNIFRVGRNLCALCKSNQTVFYKSARFIHCVKKFILGLQARDHLTEDVVVLLRCAVQFLCNYSTGNLENQQQVWTMFQDLFLPARCVRVMCQDLGKLIRHSCGFPEQRKCYVFDLLRYCLTLQDEKLENYVQMGIHICISNPESPTQHITQTDVCWDILHKCVQLAVKEESVNGLLVIEDAMKLTDFCEKVFNRLDNQLKILVLEVLINQLQQIPDNAPDAEQAPCDIPSISNIQFLAADFVVQSHQIPLIDTLDDSMALCIVKELEGLCIASSRLHLYPCLREMQQLVKVSISLLQTMEDLRLEGNPMFANACKMSDLENVDEGHPVFGLTRDLIRLLGNMAYKNKPIQDLIREQDGIPLILNNTNIDGKNPFIVQWSVLAIRNLTEGNPENQKSIAALKLEGVANNQPVLEEMGVTAEKDGEKVVIKRKSSE